jgi:hypothetical protein
MQTLIVEKKIISCCNRSTDVYSTKKQLLQSHLFCFLFTKPATTTPREVFVGSASLTVSKQNVTGL